MKNIMCFLAACLMGLSLSSIAAQTKSAGATSDFDEGTKFFLGQGVEKNIPKALEYWEKAADQGLVQAQCAVAELCMDGKSVPVDYAKGVKYYKMAADQGSIPAMNNLGRAYHHGFGVLQDFKEAFRYYRMAAEKGSPDAQYNLGWAYSNGIGVARDYGEAMRYYLLASEKNHSDALNNVGVAYANGFGVPQNYDNANGYYKKAASLGNATAQFNLAVAYLKGHGFTKNYPDAMRYFIMSAEQGNVSAQYNLGVIYQDGLGNRADLVRAYVWYNLAAAQGSKDARMKRDMMERNMVVADLVQAQNTTLDWAGRFDYIAEQLQTLREDSQKTGAPGKYNFGLQYYIGHSVPKSYAEAVRLLEEAAALGSYSAMELLGIIHQHGNGMEPNSAKAYMWYNLAALKLPKSIARRDALLKDLTQEQVVQAQNMSKEWLKIHHNER